MKHSPDDKSPCVLSRRAVLQGGVLSIGAATLSAFGIPSEKPGDTLRLGLLTDVHYAAKPTIGSRHYKDSLEKVALAATQFRKSDVHAVIELGDLIDAAPSAEVELGYLNKIEKVLSPSCDDRHYVLGNHCLAALTKQEFAEHTTARADPAYYSFDRMGWHIVILDACYTTEGTSYARGNFKWTDTALPDHELDWLAADLKAAEHPTIVFVHQRMDDRDETAHAIKNASKVRKILESSGKVVAVFQGHSHANSYKEIEGISYVVLRAVVEGSGAESSGHAVAHLNGDGSIRIEGFALQQAYNLGV